MSEFLQSAEPIQPGRLIWITGLAGAGKTTIATRVCARLRTQKPNVVFLDGDQLREVFGSNAGYSREERLSLAMRYARLCRLLCDQGIDVVCATISLFPECHRWNRANISRYYEVYIQVPMRVLIERDPKQLYSRALRGEISNVVGVDLEFLSPDRPDLVLDNSGTSSVSELVEAILRGIDHSLRPAWVEENI